MRNDPVEAVVADALDRARIAYTRDPRLTERLDFYLPELGVYIECKQFHSERISEQTARVGNVIVIQGMAAAAAFALMIGAPIAPKPEQPAEPIIPEQSSSTHVVRGAGESMASPFFLQPDDPETR